VKKCCGNLLALIFVTIQSTLVQASAGCDKSLQWADVVKSSVSVTPGDTVQIHRYSDALRMKRKSTISTSEYLDLGSISFVKPYDIDPIKTFMATDQVIGIPVLLLAGKFTMPCEVPAVLMRIDGHYLGSNDSSYSGTVTRLGQDLTFDFEIWKSEKPSSKTKIRGSFHLQKPLVPINRDLSIEGWGVTGKPASLPPGSTLESVAGKSRTAGVIPGPHD
jgi:hypothetical protein